MAVMAVTQHDRGFNLHLRVASKIEKLVESCEENFTWLQEVLAEAKKTFASPEIHLLPRTPSVKRTRKARHPRNCVEEEDGEDEWQKKPAKRGRKAKNSTDEAESSSTTQTESSIMGTSARVTRSSRATRSTRQHGMARVRIMEDSVDPSIAESESHSPMQDTTLNSLACNLSHKMEKTKAKAASAQSPQTEQVTKPSPKAIPGFTTLSVKGKASAFEEFMTHSPGRANVSSDKCASPKKRNAVCKILDKLRQSKSPRMPKSPVNHGSTPPSACRQNRGTISISQASSSPKPSPRAPKDSERRKSRRSSIHVVSKPLGVRKSLSKRRSSILRDKVQMPSASKVGSTIRRTPSKCRKPTPAPITLGNTDDQTDGATEPEPELVTASDIEQNKPSKTEEELAGDSTEAEIETIIGSGTEENQSSKITTDEEASAGSDSSNFMRTTRSKLRLNNAPAPRLPVSDEEPTPEEKAKSSGTENGGSEGDAEDECDSPRPKTPAPAPRTTRSKLRLNKPAPQKLPATSSDDEGPAQQAAGFRPVVPPSTLAPNRSTRSKVRQWNKQETGSPSFTQLKRVQDDAKGMSEPGCDGIQADEASPPKKRCTEACATEGSVNTPNRYSEDEAGDSEDLVDKSPSPPCPKNKVVRGGYHQTQSFINHLKKTVCTPSNLSTTVTSFIKRNTPKKCNTQTNSEKVLQKRKELEAKTKETESRLNRRQELLQQRAEEQRKRREGRQQLAAKRRMDQQRRDMDMKKEVLQKFDEKKDLKSRLLEEKQREEREKQRMREKKMAEAELRRKQEMETRHQKLQEAEVEAKKQEELQQRKREFEEAERQRRIGEQRRLEEERRIEVEQERQREVEKLKQEQEQRAKELAEQKRLKEESARRERMERERQAREAVKERERQRMEELDRIREKERERLQAMVAEKLEEKKAREEERKAREAIQKHNQALHSNTSLLNNKPKTNLNTTITKETSSVTKENTDSYEITPVKKTVVKPKHDDNYDISEMNSDDSTDDEEAPRKIVPKWAIGSNLKAALIQQHYHPPNLDEIFDTIIPLDLNLVFAAKKPRFNRRTSSACWDSPILKPSGAMP